MKNETANLMIAHSYGALDGYESGQPLTRYTDNPRQEAYKLGYDFGVALYCQDLEEAENAERISEGLDDLPLTPIKGVN